MQPETPTILVIFGATGDLSKRKLFPALFSLSKKGMLPKKFKIVGFAREDLSDNNFQKFITKFAGSGSGSFARRAIYQDGLF